MKKVLFVFAHPYPNKSRANRLVLEKVRGLAGVTINDLYEKYPFFDIDVRSEKKLVLEHDAIFFQHPLYWYSIPPLLKLWIDEVFEIGFAYGPGGDFLKGKDFWMSLTMGGPQEILQPHSATESGRDPDVNIFLTPFMQTAQLCQMIWRRPLVLHRANRVTQEALEDHAEMVRRQLYECTQALKEFN